MITLAGGTTATVPLPSWGKFTLRIFDGAGGEVMADVTKVGGTVAVYGVVGSGISVSYGTAGADMTLTNEGTGVLYVVAYSQLTTLNVDI
jgi:hypothetical protein